MDEWQWEQLEALIAKQSSDSTHRPPKQRDAFNGYDARPSIPTIREVMRIDMGELTGMPMKDFSAWTTSPFFSDILATLWSKRRTADEATVAMKRKKS